MPYTDSEPVEGALTLSGVWLGDSASPAALPLSNFAYGANSRDTTVGMMEAGTLYAGRAFPVVDYGEHEEHSVGVALDVPHGPAYRADLDRLRDFARARRPLWFRDNRGRVVYGTMTNFKHVDTGYGSSVSFVMVESHRDVTLVVA